jgi:hypothetical protein
MNRNRQRIIDRGKARKEGRRMHAFYQGFKAFRKGLVGNPHPPGSELYACWNAGYEFAQDEQVPAPEPHVCGLEADGKFGTGRLEE